MSSTRGSCAVSGASPVTKLPLAHALERPLIVGASQSANWGTTSPPERLALRHTTPSRILRVADGGAPGRRMIPKVSDAMLADRTSVLSTDVLFWDSTLHDAGPSIAALRDLVERAASHQIPIVIGDIPELLPGRQPTRTALNAAIHATCTRQRRCTVLPLDQLHRRVLQQGYLEIEGRRYTMSALLPDGLHLSTPAAEYLAEAFEKTLSHGE
jgi:hypothetical protein